MLMSLTEALIFIFPCLCRWQKRLFSFFCAYVVDRSVYFHFFQGLDFSLSFILPYPVRNSLPFTSLRSVTVGSGRGFLEGDTCKGPSRGLLKRLRPEPVAAVVALHVDVTTVEVQHVRSAMVLRVSTWRPIVANPANVAQKTSKVSTQGGQVEIIACVSYRWETWDVIGVRVRLICCT